MTERLSVYGEVLEQESMRRHTTFHIGGIVDYYIYPKSLVSFLELHRVLEENGIAQVVLGRGSNLLFDDRPFHGAVINLEKALQSYYFEKNGTLIAEAGVSLVRLAREAYQRGLSGLEFASGIPGSVGGGLYMNAGAYNSDLAALLKEVLVFRDGKVSWMAKEDLGYSYRRSLFQERKDWIILAGRFQLQPGNRDEILALMESRRVRRISSQPIAMPSAGSVFRNPPEAPAWKLIEEVGGRGLRCGGAAVSNLHCNFIVNETGEATAQNVLNLIQTLQQRVQARFGISLLTEIEYKTF